VWHAVVWTTWTSQNDIIFPDGLSTTDNMVDKVELSSWKWFLGKSPSSPCFFYEWEVQSLLFWCSKGRWGCGAWSGSDWAVSLGVLAHSWFLLSLLLVVVVTNFWKFYIFYVTLILYFISYISLSTYGTQNLYNDFL
jgi:hypothetical protein